MPVLFKKESEYITVYKVVYSLKANDVHVIYIDGLGSVARVKELLSALLDYEDGFIQSIEYCSFSDIPDADRSHTFDFRWLIQRFQAC